MWHTNTRSTFSCYLGGGTFRVVPEPVDCFLDIKFVDIRRVLVRVRTCACACYDAVARSFLARVLEVRAACSSHTRLMSKLPNQALAVAALSSDNRENFQFLTAVEDAYGGVIVEIKEPMDSAAFVCSLRVSMSNWRQRGKRGIWIKLPIEHANLVHPAVQEGFWYHHAEPSYLMLVHWLPDTVNTIPINATHRVGIGAFVMNDKREVLVVQENSGRLKGTGVWKFPTGVIDEGEDILAGAIREVKEETGIDTEFVEVLAFRQTHKSFFKKSDLFFVCMLKPLSYDIQKQDLEIEAAQWMPIEEYAALPYLSKYELLKYILDICLAKIGKGYSGFSPVPTKSAFSGEESYYMYLNAKDLNQPSFSDNQGVNLPPPSGCTNCSGCEPACPPPPYLGYPSGGAPPPPRPIQSNCPPTTSCCQFSPPNPSAYLPYNNYSASVHPVPNGLLTSFCCFFLLLFLVAVVH
ncbi:hypothetical protein H6P81_008523 [Aristolochia fimbriata]|uniref:Nudix hydrolase domain-containing protein n=1 Tax=Aristolochia fimbriata TaxID=158543 RepID=A0AAV7EIG2_ARIFI|nr:hypothetical protein H6P81_008523 [Aristolochia fimbriata]